MKTAHSSAGHRQSQPSRRGGIIVIAMVCLMLTSFLVVHMAKQAFQNRQQQRRELRIEQAAWLAESGVARAAHQLRTDAAYTGETWTISPDDLGGLEAGEVRITVTQSELTEVTVTATYPVGSATPVRRTKTVSISKNATSAQNASAPAVAEKP